MGLEELPADTPEWIREAFDRAQQPGAKTMSYEEAARKVMRNSIVSHMRQEGIRREDLYKKGFSEERLVRLIDNPSLDPISEYESLAEAVGADISEISGPARDYEKSRSS
jgi:hypothetical protein